MKMIKICSPQLGLSPISNLGGEVYDHQTIKGFCQKGIKIYTLLPKYRPYDKSIKNLFVMYFPLKHIFPPILYSFFCLPYLFKTYQKEKFDILRIHSPRFLGPAAFIFHLFYPRVHILVSAVTVDDSVIYYPIERLVFNISQKIIVQSQYMKDRLINKFNLAGNKIEVTFGGRLDKVVGGKNPPREATLVAKKDKVVVFMGGLIKRKNPLFLIKVLADLVNLVANVKLVVIGKGDLKKGMIKASDDQDLTDRVIFIDNAFGGEKNYWFSRMDLFLFPSLDEGFGLVITEAMSFGKPVISSDKAAFTEIVETGVDGFTLSLKKPKLWSMTAATVLNNKSLAKKIGQNAKKKVDQKFNWQKTYQLNYQVVKRMLK